ncbi:MAG: LysR family transcriptional regulator [Bacillota bacterium]
MNIEQFQYVVEVAKTGSITQAAQNLHISQPGISQAITNLEEELKVKIFNRTRLGVTPTEQGRELIKIAFEIIMKLHELKEKAALNIDSLHGVLRMSVNPGFMSYVVDPLFIFKKEYPRVRVELAERGSHEVIEDLIAKKIDMGLCRFSEDLGHYSNKIVFERLLEGEIKVRASRYSSLALNHVVTPEELQHQSIVLFNSQYMRWFVDDFTSRYGPLNILFTTNNRVVIRKALREGVAITFSPDLPLLSVEEPNSSDKDIVNISILYHKPLSVSFGAARLSTKPLSPIAQIFLKYVKENISNETQHDA